MSGPWAKYAAPTEAGPWAKYQPEANAEEGKPVEREAAEAMVAKVEQMEGLTLDSQQREQAIQGAMAGDMKLRIPMPQQRVVQTRESQPDHNPTEGMGTGERLWAGAGAALSRVPRMVEQAVAGVRLHPYAGPMAPGLMVDSQRREAEQRQVDAPLNDTGAGLTGNILGTLAPVGALAFLTRGSSLAPMVMPTTIRGAALQGAALGAAQPTAAPGERLQNTGLGALAGAGGQAAPMAVGAGARGLAGLLRAPTASGMERRAGQVIADMATDPARLAQPQPSAIPGVVRSLAEETMDPGVAQLQRQHPVALAEQQMRNNAARREAIRQEFGGADDAAIDAIRIARDDEARRALRGLRSKSDIAMGPVIRGVDALIAKQKGRPAVANALQYVKDQLSSGIENADQAYNVRKTIGDLMEGRLSGDLASATTARGELMLVRGLLDREMRKAVPQWGAYLQGYKAASRRMDQVAVGKHLLDKTAKAGEDALGERTMTPAAFARVTNDPNAMVRGATGFPKARADRVVSPAQRELVEALRDDMRRVGIAQDAGRGLGSPTAQNLATQAAVNRVGQLLGKFTPEAVNRVVAGGANAYRARVNDIVGELLADPVRARAVLAKLPPKDRVLVEREIARVTGVLSAVAAPPLTK